jgi:hypothetical protein
VAHISLAHFFGSYVVGRNVTREIETDNGVIVFLATRETVD